jgi:hypothetical protein
VSVMMCVLGVDMFIKWAALVLTLRAREFRESKSLYFLLKAVGYLKYLVLTKIEMA